jgi:hypothetical protein
VLRSPFDSVTPPIGGMAPGCCPDLFFAPSAITSSIILPSLFPVALDVFGLFLVHARHSIAGAALRVEQFIKLGLHGLSITVLCALNEQGHEPNGHGGEAMPTICSSPSPLLLL